jgi:hypothetical protein
LWLLGAGARRARSSTLLTAAAPEARDVAHAPPQILQQQRPSELSDIPESMVRTLKAGRTQMRFKDLLCLARALRLLVIELFADAEEDETGDDG